MSLKPSRPPKEQQERKHRAQAFVRPNDPPDAVRYHALECCPDCRRKLSGGWEHDRRQTIQILLPPVRVIDHVMLGRWCGVCQKRWLPKLSDEVIGAQGRRRFGVSVQALVAVLHIGYRVPMKMVKRMLRELFGLRISAGEVVALLDGVKLAGEGRRQQLLEQDADRPQVGAWVEALRAVGGPTCATLCQVSRRAPSRCRRNPSSPPARNSCSPPPPPDSPAQLTLIKSELLPSAFLIDFSPLLW